MPLAELKNVSLHYHLAGPAGAPVVVLSNSLGADLSMWDSQMEALTSRFLVLRYDTRGHGQSSAGAGPYTLDELGGDVVELMDRLQIAQAHVCGVSLGGLTALWLGVHAPERILSIMPCNTAAKIGTAEGWDERIQQVTEDGLASIADATMTRWFTADFRQSHAQTAARIRHTFSTNNALGYARCCAALKGADLREQIAAIAAPALVITGTWDPATPPAEGQFLHAHLRDSAYLELNAAHLSNIEAAGQFSRAIVDFMSPSQ